MSAQRIECEALTCPPPYFHKYRCMKRATRTVEYRGRERHVCGTHANAFNRLPEPSACSWEWRETD